MTPGHSVMVASGSPLLLKVVYHASVLHKRTDHLMSTTPGYDTLSWLNGCLKRFPFTTRGSLPASLYTQTWVTQGGGN